MRVSLLVIRTNGLGYWDDNNWKQVWEQDNWKRVIILFTREPDELNPLSISEQCTLAINAKSHQIDKINWIAVRTSLFVIRTNGLGYWNDNK